MGGGGRMVIERVAFYKILSPKGELIIEVGGGGRGAIERGRINRALMVCAKLFVRKVII